MSKVPVKRKFSPKVEGSVYPNFGYVDKVDESNKEFPLTYYYNFFRNEMKADMDEEFTQDTLKHIRYITRQFCDTQAVLFQTPKHFFAKLIANLLLEENSEENQAKIINVLCREYDKLRSHKLIARHKRNPMWQLIKYMTVYAENRIAVFNIFAILYFYEV